ncbi:formate dehydrogenase [Desulfuribacillus stibiiarsenatis]|uniref:Formate dehydrogenase n=3 Tax=Desulfuribacillus stibiiarsenatis TaxID=1390249 RepID=A0A1E5L5G2_9FIRM|nr:formate dehydrogenase [Desulfuribacillus stibiiarsenatis]
MGVTRRQFLKLSGATAATLAVVDLGFDANAVQAKTQTLKIESATEVPSICPYCSVGCGIICYTKDGKLISSEGDPRNPNNRGSLCSKGSSLKQTHYSHKRVKNPMYRAAGSDKWEEKDWEWMLDRIAEKMKETRDATFRETLNGITVNHNTGIASLGGAALENEECYLISKLMRGLGTVWLEHQARI